MRLLVPLIFTFVISSLSFAPTVSARDQADSASNRYEQRKLYQELLQAIKTNQRSKYNAQKDKLIGYPLYPYLEYTDKIYRISRQSEANIQSFISQYADTPLANQLLQNWLYTLAKRGEWSTFINNYNDYRATDSNICNYAFALYKTGATQEALDQAQTLWLVKHSQPDSCDPIFKIWQDEGYLTDEIAWQRYEKALTANNVTLANYLTRFLAKSDRKQANDYKIAHTRPESLFRSKPIKPTNPRSTAILLHALKRSARKNALAALTSFEANLPLAHAESDDIADTYQYIGERLARDPDLIEHLVRIEHHLEPTKKLNETRLRAALRNQSWQEVLLLISKLDQDAIKSDRWKYWRARSLEAINHESDKVIIDELYAELSNNRSYYGFLAADKTSKAYSFQRETITVSDNELLDLEATPGIQRASELLILGEKTRARREWNFTVQDYSHKELAIAAMVAKKWGWHKQAIQAMIDSGRWNALDIRFPLAYLDSFRAAARKSDIPANWNLSIARQESAFMADAKSSAGALGLMQLLPSTAKSTARRQGLKEPTNLSLTDPYKNIEIGSAYLGQMLRRFDNNRILASAAYNAGPTRVSRWINKSVPLDVWIETIPYSETRNYVMNILMFSTIYADKLEQQPVLIYPHEYDSFSDSRRDLEGSSL
jgi:soluble lytic murein transglycosylase